MHQPNEKSKKDGGDRSISNSEKEFRSWRSNIPLEHTSVRPLGGRLESFFREARRLIEVDENLMQNVIRSLSSEGGLRRIQELIERNFGSWSATVKAIVFSEGIIPFLEIIAHPDILASLVLEQQVGTIYNFIFGIGGRRGVQLFSFIADVLGTHNNAKEKAIWHLEVSLLVFRQVIETNSAAFIHEPFKPLAMRFEDIFEALSSADSSNSLYQARTYLERIQRRLDIGSSLPGLNENSSNSTQQKQVVGFVTPRDPPGGRHDNDHGDICKIRIMPTSQEISCRRTEYLPTKDPRQWHEGGVKGLLDKNFRLLREDTIGLLRDAIHDEMQFSSRRGAQRNQVKTYIYRDARVDGLRFSRLSGLHFEVAFPQPLNVRRMGPKQRQEWWMLSKRLQADALVCLVDSQRHTTFCTVIGPEREQKSKPEEEAKRKEREKDAGSLWNDAKMASIVLGLVEFNDDSVQYILDRYGPNGGTSTLSVVEFPGVLLPAFQPTLSALQTMKRSADLPFPEFLAPTNLDRLSGWVDVPPPAYALKPGFSFNLQCLLNNGSSLEVRPGQPVDIKKLQENSSLDDAQAMALVNALQRRIGLIQGPPGTGKSFTGVALIKVLLANKLKANVNIGPVICVCYTNHALDQLLEGLLARGVSQIIRIGSRSKSEILGPLNLRTVVKETKKTKFEKGEQYRLFRELEQLEEDFNGLRFGTQGSDGSVRSYLRKHEKWHHDQLFGMDEEGFQRAGDKSQVIKQWLRYGKRIDGDPRSVQELQYTHVDQMSNEERRILHDHWVKEIKANIYNQAKQIACSHRTTKANNDKIRDEVDLRCLRNADVIGVTTTGLARNLNMLRKLRSKVVLCEEAGEVLEAHLLTALLPSVEHAILIGDHLQLRPQIQNYELSRENLQGGEQYSLDVSLFERLVKPDNGTGAQIQFSTLKTQRRMHPSISQLVRDTLYPQLEDAPSTSEYPSVVGMRKRLFWLDHRKPEAKTSSDDAMATSHWNNYEIDVVTALVNHFVRQGAYKNDEIAVLTPYLGQLHRLRERLSASFTIVLGERDQDDLENAGFDTVKTPAHSFVAKTTLLKALRVATIDNFQGEEAKVVVISLVRSNEKNSCGFLRTANRINVLLSRAQHGMYIIGNSETSHHVPMWAQVIDILQKDGNFGTSLELQCPRHPDTAIMVSKPDDFVRFSPEGGCNQRCLNRLPCGHACVQKCHSVMVHNAVHCLEPCQRPQKGCSHPCPKRCGDPCPILCNVSVYQADRVLPCGHSMPTLPCWQAQDLGTVRCKTKVKKIAPGCKHEVTIPCHVDVDAVGYKCEAPCQSHLQCGHTCKRPCRECTVRDEDGGIQTNHGNCQQKCGRNQSTCAHVCNTVCHGENPCPPCQENCDVHCSHSRCVRKCCEPCTPCAEEKCLSACPHSACSMPCAAPCDHIPCSKRCARMLACGHQCPSVCGESCPPESFCQVCGSEEVKNRDVDFILGESYRNIDLDKNPCVFPQCGHFLTMESMDGQMNLKQYYVTDADERPIAIASSSQPFSVADIKTCATCRGSLRNISRYGRLVRRAILDESTKKFILYVNREHVPLAEELPKLIKRLHDQEGKVAVQLFQSEIRLEGPRACQIKEMYKLLNHDKLRWREIMDLRKRVTEYRRKVTLEEQPFNQVRNLVEGVRRRKVATGEFEFDESVLQTKGYLLATALALRLDIALLADFLNIRRKINEGSIRSEVHLDIQYIRDDCQILINKAQDSQQIVQQVEGHLFLAQLYALKASHSRESNTSEDYMERGSAAIKEARRICDKHPDQTRGLPDEIDNAEKMVRGSTFYTAVTSDERMAVVAAMAREFRGTGHWYYCPNGHPFTIGECGGAMQLATCPECGARVGGRHHQTAAGVTRADDMEEVLRNMTI